MRKVLHAVDSVATWFADRRIQEAAVLAQCRGAREDAAAAKQQLEAARKE